MAKKSLNKDYKIEKKDYYFIITSSSKIPTTPKGNPITNKNERLVQLIIDDLKTNQTANPEIFGYYSIYCTYCDFFLSNDNPMSIDEFRQIIESDLSLNLVAGPECIDQINFFDALTDFLEHAKIQHTIYGWTESFEKIVHYFFDLFNQLTPIQKACAVNSSQVHGSMLYGILLAMGKCTTEQYAKAMAGGNCIIPEVFEHVSDNELSNAMKHFGFEAKILKTYMEHADIQ